MVGQPAALRSDDICCALCLRWVCTWPGGDHGESSIPKADSAVVTSDSALFDTDVDLSGESG